MDPVNNPQDAEQVVIIGQMLSDLNLEKMAYIVGYCLGRQPELVIAAYAKLMLTEISL